jgi:hypothetical protein
MEGGGSLMPTTPISLQQRSASSQHLISCNWAFCEVNVSRNCFLPLNAGPRFSSKEIISQDITLLDTTQGKVSRLPPVKSPMSFAAS